MSAGSARFLAFVDGSSLSNPGGPGGTGYVVLDRSRPALRFGGTRWTEDGGAGVTNNRMELRAVLDALTKWVHGWRRKGWKTAAGEPVLNRDLIEALDARIGELRVRFQWVRGHDGHAVNEVVDQLAQAAARGAPGPGEDEVVAALKAVQALR